MLFYDGVYFGHIERFGAPLNLHNTEAAFFRGGQFVIITTAWPGRGPHTNRYVTIVCPD